ncbi:uncharacterized protein LOC122032295 [Zingiber officinale]|uniref:uncharacterized protein LOC122032295 n=1 Tax=Zingiber officinale TaxID=94328 RepID=UPI001C4BA7CE|nr:uncharacterized protein LOC122032295 [Zingiber officinale]
MENRSSKASRSSGRHEQIQERTQEGFLLSKLQLFKRHKKAKQLQKDIRRSHGQIQDRTREGFLLSKLQLFKRHKKALLQLDTRHDRGFLLSKLQLFEPHKSAKQLQRDELVKFSRFSLGKQEQYANGICKGF